MEMEYFNKSIRVEKAKVMKFVLTNIQSDPFKSFKELNSRCQALSFKNYQKRRRVNKRKT